MKRRLAITALVVAIISSIAYFVPIAVSASGARPLYGNFDIGKKCIGGHEIFLYLDEDEAFENCPGHRHMSLLGRIERIENSVTIHLKHDDAPWFRVDLDGSDHTFVNLEDSSTHELPQVNNPWRTRLPRLLPGH